MLTVSQQPNGRADWTPTIDPPIDAYKAWDGQTPYSLSSVSCGGLGTVFVSDDDLAEMDERYPQVPWFGQKRSLGGKVMVRRLLRVLAVLVVGAGLVAAGWWAARSALEPPSDPLGADEPVVYEVVDGTVGRSLPFAAVAEWPMEDLARNAAMGVVTSVGVADGEVVDADDVLYSVDLRPVVVAPGVVPAFRDLTLRVEGPDVAQLQGFLSRLGFYDGEVDGSFESGTRAAVVDWQEAIGVPGDGVVRAGDLVFVPELPVRIALDEGVSVGAPLVGGEVTVRRVVGDPSFTIPLSPEQRSLVPLDADVLVSHSGGVWEARIQQVREDDALGQLSLDLEAVGGGSVCGGDCAAEVALGGMTDFSSELVVVPETAGPVVPLAAIMTAVDGSTSVTTREGRVVVEIVAASAGLAVVDGVSVGDEIILPISGSDQ